MSWSEGSTAAPFGASELPYGVYSVAGQPPKVGVALADQVIDVAAVCRDVGRDPSVFEQGSLKLGGCCSLPSLNGPAAP